MGGSEWHEAEVANSTSPFDVQRWRFLLKPGREDQFNFVCRATDSSGNVQPVEDRWNRGGYGNNGLHGIYVSSSDSSSSELELDTE